MSMGLKKRIALILLFCAVTIPFCGAIYAAAPETVGAPVPAAETAAETAPAVKAADVPAWTETSEKDRVPDDRVTLYADGIRAGDCLLVKDTSYVSAEAFCRILHHDAETLWDTETETLTVRWDGFSLTMRAGDGYFTANGRYFYVPGGILSADETLMLPIRSIASAFSLVPAWDGETRSVSVDTTAMKLPAQAAYDETDLYWLSRIIRAESGNQPLEGRIGVGNVVLNRVADPSCPDNVYDVIFDRRYGVQFSPTVTGAIYAEPDELSIVAAKLCLDGCSMVGNSLYFVNPTIGAGGWFARTRTYVTAIGDHVFYA